MFSRIISRHTRRLTAHFRIPITPPTSPVFPSSLYHSSNPNLSPPFYGVRFFSSGNSNGNGNNGKNSRHPQSTSDAWKLISENDDPAVFGNYDGDLKGMAGGEGGEAPWVVDAEATADPERDVFHGVENRGGGEDMWAASVGVEGESELKPWSIGGDDKEEDVFAFREEGSAEIEVAHGLSSTEKEMTAEELAALQKEEEALTAVLKGPNRAFGDLVAASGISDAMLDSLMALKNFDEIDGLPPLAEIEDMRYENSMKKSTRAEMERLKQEELAKSRVRNVDDKGRAYGTGRRKCSIARVWIQPGDGNFLVNDKEFDVYFPMLDHRAALLRPFSETKTLGLWDVKCTVKGGGVSDNGLVWTGFDGYMLYLSEMPQCETGQVGAVRLGISRAMQNWEPGLRPPLREAGFLTRDPRAVERKKPGKAKARKSFQWVKR